LTLPSWRTTETTVHAATITTINSHLRLSTTRVAERLSLSRTASTRSGKLIGVLRRIGDQAQKGAV
jgi:hypothetical protein